MSVALDGTLNAVVFDVTSANSLVLKSGANTVAWTLTLPTSPGTAGQVLSTNGSGVTSWVTGGGGGTPSAPVNSIQFNNAGSFGGDAGISVVGPSAIKLGVASSQQGTLALASSLSSFAVSVTSAANAAPWTLTLPAGPGTNGQVLATNGSGVTSWTTVSAAIPVTDDNTTAADEFPLFTDTAGGAGVDLTQAYTSSTEYTFNPAAGQLTAPHVCSSAGIFLNSQIISANYTIPAGTNGLTAGPITTNPGVTITVSPAQSWVIV
jgi:hypothetical protein